MLPPLSDRSRSPKVVPEKQGPWTRETLHRNKLVPLPSTFDVTRRGRRGIAVEKKTNRERICCRKRERSALLLFVIFLPLLDLAHRSAFWAPFPPSFLFFFIRRQIRAGAAVRMIKSKNCAQFTSLSLRRVVYFPSVLPQVLHTLLLFRPSCPLFKTLFSSLLPKDCENQPELGYFSRFLPCHSTRRELYALDITHKLLHRFIGLLFSELTHVAR